MPRRQLRTCEPRPLGRSLCSMSLCERGFVLSPQCLHARPRPLVCYHTLSSEQFVMSRVGFGKPSGYICSNCIIFSMYPRLMFLWCNRFQVSGSKIIILTIMQHCGFFLSSNFGVLNFRTFLHSSFNYMWLERCWPHFTLILFPQVSQYGCP